MKRSKLLAGACIATVMFSQSLVTIGPPVLASAGTPLPGAPNCPIFPSDNVWNTPIANLPVNPQSATWLASMNSVATNIHFVFGPTFGMPFEVVSPSQPLVPIAFEYADQSDPGPYPLSADTPIQGGAGGTGDRHAIMVNPTTCNLYELYNAQYERVRLDRRRRSDMEPQLQRATTGGLDLRRCRRPSDSARARSLRRGAVRPHNACHPDDGRVD